MATRLWATWAKEVALRLTLLLAGVLLLTDCVALPSPPPAMLLLVTPTANSALPPASSIPTRSSALSIGRPCTLLTPATAALVWPVSPGLVMPIASATDPAIHGTRWRMTAFCNEQGLLEPPVMGWENHVEFRTDSTLSDSGGCNPSNARYWASGGQMQLTEQSPTLRFCTNSRLMRQDNWRYRILAYGITDSELTIT